jgi:hypothetical protein
MTHNDDNGINNVDPPEYNEVQMVEKTHTVKVKPKCGYTLEYRCGIIVIIPIVAIVTIVVLVGTFL